MAQVKDLVVTGQSHCVGPATFTEIIKIGNAVISYDETNDNLKITFEEEE
jgi:hypothetical protein